MSKNMPKKHYGESETHLEFQKLKLTEIYPYSLIFLIGKRNTGKTVLIRDLCYNFYLHKLQEGESIDFALCFSPTEDTQGAFASFIPYCNIYPQYREDVVLQLMETQRALLKKNGHTKNCLIIIDDCAYDKKLFKSETMRLLCMNGRHLKIMLLLSVQYCMDIPTAVRGNIDLTLALRDNTYANKEKYYKNFFGQFKNLHQFIEAFDTLTNNYGAIVSINNSHSTNLEETIFWYRADPDSLPKKFRLGKPIFWQLSDICYKEEDDGAAKRPPVVMLEPARSEVARSEVVPSSRQQQEPHPFPQESSVSRRSTTRAGRPGTPARRDSSTMIRQNQPTLPGHIVIE
jgi:hypothetical protein